MRKTVHIQGDVMLRIVKRPHDLVPAGKGSEILALGETTGHGHVLEGCDIMIGADEAKYVIPRNSVQARLLHKHLTQDHPADHGPLVLGEQDRELRDGECYKVVLQQVYNPFMALFERVRD